MGAGLFPVIRFAKDTDNSSGTIVSDLTLTGSITFNNFYTFGFGEKGRFADAAGRVGVGMLAGRVLDNGVSATFTNVQLKSVTVDAATSAAGAPFVGGLLGYCGTQNNTADAYKVRAKALTFTNCSYNTLSFTGFTEVGGLVGFA